MKIDRFNLWKPQKNGIQQLQETHHHKLSLIPSIGAPFYEFYLLKLQAIHETCKLTFKNLSKKNLLIFHS